MEPKYTFEYADVALGINYLADSCYKYAKIKGFWDDEDKLLHFVDFPDAPNNEKWKNRILSLFNSEKIALEHSELSERLETLRKDPDKIDEHCPEFKNIEIECADLIIRCLDFCGRRNLRIGEAIVAKMAFNETREHMHGKNF